MDPELKELLGTAAALLSQAASKLDRASDLLLDKSDEGDLPDIEVEILEDVENMARQVDTFSNNLITLEVRYEQEVDGCQESPSDGTSAG